MTCQMVIEPLEEDAVRVVVTGELAGSSAYTLDTELRKVEGCSRTGWCSTCPR